MTDTRTITACCIKADETMAAMMIAVTGSPNGINIVMATLEDGSEMKLFTYYTDELSFTESEFAGLTVAEALRLFHDRDVAYLRS